VSLRDRNAHGHVNRAIALKIIGNMTPAKNRDAKFVRVPTINQHFDMSQKQVYVIHASVFEVPHTWLKFGKNEKKLDSLEGGWSQPRLSDVFVLFFQVFFWVLVTFSDLHIFVRWPFGVFTRSSLQEPIV